MPLSNRRARPKVAPEERYPPVSTVGIPAKEKSTAGADSLVGTTDVPATDGSLYTSRSGKVSTVPRVRTLKSSYHDQ